MTSLSSGEWTLQWIIELWTGWTAVASYSKVRAPVAPCQLNVARGRRAKGKGLTNQSTSTPGGLKKVESMQIPGNLDPPQFSICYFVPQFSICYFVPQFFGVPTHLFVSEWSCISLPTLRSWIQSRLFQKALRLCCWWHFERGLKQNHWDPRCHWTRGSLKTYLNNRAT